MKLIKTLQTKTEDNSEFVYLGIASSGHKKVVYSDTELPLNTNLYNCLDIEIKGLCDWTADKLGYFSYGDLPEGKLGPRNLIKCAALSVAFDIPFEELRRDIWNGESDSDWLEDTFKLHVDEDEVWIDEEGIDWYDAVQKRVSTINSNNYFVQEFNLAVQNREVYVNMESVNRIEDVDLIEDSSVEELFLDWICYDEWKDFVECLPKSSLKELFSQMVSWEREEVDDFLKELADDDKYSEYIQGLFPDEQGEENPDQLNLF